MILRKIVKKGLTDMTFKEMLETELGAEVVLWDERLTTVSAHALMNETNVRGQKRKNSVDSVSAAFILQSYLDSI